ncbi:MAG: ABC transporter ATP-binding protein [Pseudomonadota bacterium]
MTSAPALDAQQLSYQTAQGVRLLQEVSFSLAQGGVLAIAGPNGAGKSTLLNLLCGLMIPTTGEIHVSGRALGSLSAPERARSIAVVGQQEVPDARLSLADYVALGQIPIEADQARAAHLQDLERVLSLTQLTALKDHRMGQLSGGERQRAHIARALAQKPDLLFLDEPTNHLDPDAKGKMLSLVTALGITVVMIVHDLVLIPAFASHMALIHEGRLTAFGTVETVLTAQNVRDVFGVAYLSFEHEGRTIPALDIQKTSPPANERSIAL